MKVTEKSMMCPISHKSCKLCTLFIGRHYYSFSSCKAYLRNLHERGSGSSAENKMNKDKQRLI